MTPTTVLLIALGYVAVLLGIAAWSSSASQHQDSETRFFVAGQKAPWYVVAFGMIGASLSGVTFLSIPGWVRDQEWSYMQMVSGYCIGYVIVATVLLPLYYKLKLTSIYGYLGTRFGVEAHRTGAGFFILSRVIGASFRLFLVALVLDVLVLEPLCGGATPWTWFGLTTAGILSVIYIYTRTSGMGTVIWTDTLQTACMLLAVVLTIGGILSAGGHSWMDLPHVVSSTGLTDVWVTEDWRASNHWVKHMLAGMFVTIAMTGLDQDMMQKNLACRNLREAQWNMGSFTVILVGANLLFLTMGAMLWMHAQNTAMALPEATDRLYPLVAMGGTLGPALGRGLCRRPVGFGFQLCRLCAHCTDHLHMRGCPRHAKKCLPSVPTHSPTGAPWHGRGAVAGDHGLSCGERHVGGGGAVHGGQLHVWPAAWSFCRGHVHHVDPQSQRHPMGLPLGSMFGLRIGANLDGADGLQLWVCAAPCQRAVDRHWFGCDFCAQTRPDCRRAV